MTVRLTLIPDGPIKLSAEQEAFPVLRCRGGDISPDKAVFLCRCGESARKPFCDGAHGKAGYSDENRCDRDALQDYAAEGITVHFNRAICSGAARCVHNLPDVFESASEDWIHPEKAPVEDVIATIEKCPSGALSYTRDNRAEITGSDQVSVRIVPDGPYEIAGPVAFAPPHWSVHASRTKFALCRCGQSANAPFCDYTHGEQGWKDGQDT